MADDADVKDAEITLDDFNSDEQDTAKTDPSPVKEAKAEKSTKAEIPEAKGKEAETKADDTAVPPDVPTKDDKAPEAQADETETPEDKPQGKAEERKAQLNSEIRDLVSQRNAIKAKVEKANAEVYQPATENELTEQGMSQLEAKVEAMRQQQEMEKYTTQVADAQLTLSSESERVLNDFPIFNPDSPDYDKELAEEAASTLDANLILDPNTNQVIGSNLQVYPYYKTLARASGISVVRGQIKGQADTEKQLANVDAPSNVAPPKQKSDPLMDLWKSDD